MFCKIFNYSFFEIFGKDKTFPLILKFSFLSMQFNFNLGSTYSSSFFLFLNLTRKR